MRNCHEALINCIKHLNPLQRVRFEPKQNGRKIEYKQGFIYLDNACTKCNGHINLVRANGNEN